MTIYEYLEEFENMTLKIIENVGLDPAKVEDIYERVDSTFNYVVETLKEAQEVKNNENKIEENEKV